jgi:dGTP triphosphohydrolase
MDDLRAIPLAREAYERTRPRGTYVRGALIDLMSSDLLRASGTDVGFSPTMRQAMGTLHGFLSETLYHHPHVTRRTEEGTALVLSLCTYLAKNPDAKVRTLQERTGGTLPEAVKDYVAGMTDAFVSRRMQEYTLA